MTGTAKRKIGEEKIRKITCKHCNEVNTLFALIYSKFFLLKILPFVYNKTAEISCTNCKKAFIETDFNVTEQLKIEEVKGFVKHPWFLYIGYIIIIPICFYAIIKDHI